MFFCGKFFRESRRAIKVAIVFFSIVCAFDQGCFDTSVVSSLVHVAVCDALTVVAVLYGDTSTGVADLDM